MLMGYRFAFATFTVPSLPSYRGPVNGIYGKAVTLDHNYKDVITANADTPYSFGMVDLRAEPAVIQVPALTDRYYSIQIEDIFGCNIHYIGSRATVSDAGAYLLVEPGWDGQGGDEFDGVLPLETELAFVVGRTQLLSAEDVPAATKVMEGYKLQTLSAYRGEDSPTPEPVQWPVWIDEASRDERFIGYLNFLLTFCLPIHPDEAELMARFAQIGIGVGKAFDAEVLSDEVRDSIRAGVVAAREATAAKTLTAGQKINGWISADIFGNREFYSGDYLLRAAGAMAGWGGNDSAEAMYPTARFDDSGELLDGAHCYQLTFTVLPPTKAFWSITIYDTSYDGKAGYMIENPINRYLINSTTPGLVYADDGSLTITIQREQPEDAAEQANWLPAPEGVFYMALRMYWPEQAALKRTWNPPQVVRKG